MWKRAYYAKFRWQHRQVHRVRVVYWGKKLRVRLLDVPVDGLETWIDRDELFWNEVENQLQTYAT